jgi:Protein of unknown function (DUF2742)
MRAKDNRPTAGGAASLRKGDPQSSKVIWSQQVSWWSVHEFVAPWLEIVGSWPTVGTPEWCALPDSGAAKIAALCDAAQHWALRVETCQEARADASKAISAAVPLVDDDELSVKTKPATDWKAVAQEIQRRRGVYSPRAVDQ